MHARRLSLALFLAAPLALATAVPAAAQQQSESYKFLSAIDKEDGKVVTDMIEAPGSTIINTKQVTTGKGALHILTSHAGSLYMQYLLQHKADPNIRDAKGNTPLILATMAGREDLVSLLLTYKANPNLANGQGQTPLILAVNNRDVDLTRLLLSKGGDPDQTDNLAGMSARDYAIRDARNPALVALFKDLPKKTRAAVAGPKL
ncbi:MULTISPECIES: ankyrin repeat domain-containing protein [unclassified Sphingomonas]|uniref:ankyrin repeat domain-containing protein n=1 Tax=unclassified Sphingomonas TaxID=196159 RepID=UPI000E10539B|nr:MULTISPECIES: ankyrin repeat domain-containing protein [unclassified Sphingomonas]AXJ96888.1 ankyrin repeat domain-containing protein [Sphingomonas sp. FARSPH]